MLQPPRGTRDFPPEEMKKLQYVTDIIRKIFEKYSFQPLETPAFEDYKILSKKSGDAIKKEIYFFKDKSDRELGLRFDLTVPTARFIAANPNLPKPFKRYQMGRVWRYDRPQAGRYREFRQADVDIFGSKSITADSECLQCFCEVMKKLGFKDFFIRVNNRKISEALVLASGVNKKNVIDVFRIIDKLDKIGTDGVKSELIEKKLYNQKLFDYLKMNLNQIEKVIGKFDIGKEGIIELKELLTLAKNLDYNKSIKVDFSLIRGLEYYTGLVFELFAGGNLSCGGGGRYDDLVEQLGGRPTQATGISFGIDRVINLMDQKNLFKPDQRNIVFVVSVSDSVRKVALNTAKILRDAGIITDVDVMGRDMKKQLNYVNKKGVQYAIFVGEKEIKSGKFVLKDMKSGKQKNLSLKNIINVLT